MTGLDLTKRVRNYCNMQQTHELTRTYTRIHIQNTFTYIHLYTYIYIHIYTCSHTPKHTHIYSPKHNTQHSHILTQITPIYTRTHKPTHACINTHSLNYNTQNNSCTLPAPTDSNTHTLYLYIMI